MLRFPHHTDSTIFDSRKACLTDSPLYVQMKDHQHNQQQTQSKGNAYQLESECQEGKQMTPPAFQIQASDPPEDGRTIQRASARPAESDMQGENKVTKSNFGRVSNEQQHMIDAFCSQAHRIIGKWKKIRPEHAKSMEEMSMKEYKTEMRHINDQLSDLIHDFDSTFTGTRHVTTKETAIPNSSDAHKGSGHYHMMAWTYNPLVKAEVIRQLNAGYFPQYLREMEAMYGNSFAMTGLSPYVRIFEEEGLWKFSRIWHIYTLITHWGGSMTVDALNLIRDFMKEMGKGSAKKGGGPKLDAGVGIPVGVFLKGYQISYENELGLAWKTDIYSIGAQGGLSASASASTGKSNNEESTEITMGGESSGGSEEVNAGTAITFRYYPPQYFAKQNFNGAASLGYQLNAEAGGTSGEAGEAGSILQIGEVVFDTSGKTASFSKSIDPSKLAEIWNAESTQVGAEAKYEIGIGTSLGMGKVRDFKGLGPSRKKEMAGRGGWQRVLEAIVFFKSEESELDSDDWGTIMEVIDAIASHEKYYPGDVFELYITGTATQRWIAPDKSAKEQNLDTSGLPRNEERRQMELKNTLNIKLAGERAQTVKSEIETNLAYEKGTRLSDEVIHASTIIVRDPEIRRSTSKMASDNAPNDRKVVIELFYSSVAEDNLYF